MYTPRRNTSIGTNEYLLRSKDVAHILDCSPNDVIELARRGKIKLRFSHLIN